MPTARAYHHGNLRAALIESATAILRDEGLDALTLRAVARRAKVSQTAPYRHFADRAELVAAVAEAGFRALHAEMLESVSKARGGRRGLQALGLGYVRFAMRHPQEYRLMFGSGAPLRRVQEGYRDAATGVFELLRHGIARLQDAGLVKRGDSREIAMSAWALVHGVAMLALDELIPEGKSVDQIAEQATEILMFGMAPRAES